MAADVAVGLREQLHTGVEAPPADGRPGSTVLWVLAAVAVGYGVSVLGYGLANPEGFEESLSGGDSAGWVRYLYQYPLPTFLGSLVTVYYARTNEPNPTGTHRPTGWWQQPLLPLLAPDGRMWTATPGMTSYSRSSGSQDTGGSTTHHLPNNPWIAPLHALEDGNRRVFDEDTLTRRPLPVDLQAPAQERVRAALATLGRGSKSAAASTWWTSPRSRPPCDIPR